MLSQQTLYQPHQYQKRQITDLESITELSRTSTGSTQYSTSSDVYVDPDHDLKIQLNFTIEEINLVRTTWKEMISDDLSRTSTSANNSTSASSALNTHSSIASSLFCIQFYSNLLAMDSNLEKMFPSIKHQAISFAGVLSTAIVNLDNLSVLDDYLSNLGKRHSRILGIDPPHFELMGVALLKTFKDRFGSFGGFTLELERCWARLYTYLANSILQFGIDPVLRNEKINNDIYQVSNSSFGRINSTQTFVDQRSSSISSQGALRAPAGRNSSVSSASSATTLTTTNSTYATTTSNLKNPMVSVQSTSRMKVSNKFSSKRASRIGKPNSGMVDESEEEKCIIM